MNKNKFIGLIALMIFLVLSTSALAVVKYKPITNQYTGRPDMTLNEEAINISTINTTEMTIDYLTVINITGTYLSFTTGVITNLTGTNGIFDYLTVLYNATIGEDLVVNNSVSVGDTSQPRACRWNNDGTDNWLNCSNGELRAPINITDVDIITANGFEGPLLNVNDNDAQIVSNGNGWNMISTGSGPFGGQGNIYVNTNVPIIQYGPAKNTEINAPTSYLVEIGKDIEMNSNDIDNLDRMNVENRIVLETGADLYVADSPSVIFFGDGIDVDLGWDDTNQWLEMNNFGTMFWNIDNVNGNNWLLGHINASEGYFRGDVEMNGNNITNPNVILFNTTGCDDTTTEGAVCWNSDQQTLNIVTGLGNVYQVGQELTGVGKNLEGSTIYNGQVVYQSGSQGEMPTIMLADASNGSKIHTPAVVTIASCNNNALCPVTTFGYVRNIKTNQWSEGDVLYLSSDGSGNLTNVQQSYPNYNIRMGRVIRSHVSSGVILVLPEIDIGDGVVLNFLDVVTDLRVMRNAEFKGGYYNFTDTEDPLGFGASVIEVYSNSTQTSGCFRGYNEEDEYVAVCKVGPDLPVGVTGTFANSSIFFNSDGDSVFWNNDNGSFIFSADPDGNKNFTENIRFELKASGDSFFYGSLDFQANNVSNINRLTAPDGSAIQFGAPSPFSSFDQAIVFATNQSLPAGEISHALIDINGEKILRTWQVGLPFAAGYMRNSQIVGEDFTETNATKVSRCDIYWDMRNSLLNKTSALDIDCSSNAYSGSGTGADLLIEDDIKAGGTIFADGGFEGTTIFTFLGTDENLDADFIDTDIHLRTGRLDNITFGAGFTSNLEKFDAGLGTYTSLFWSVTADVIYCNSDGLCAATSSGTDEDMYRTYDFANKTNITLQFYYGGLGLDAANDDLYAVISNGSTSQQIWNITLVGSNNNIPSTATAVLNISENLWNQSNVNITFYCTTSNPSEACYIDDINVTTYDSTTNTQEVVVLDAQFDLGDRENSIEVNGTTNTMSLISPKNVTIGEPGKPGGLRFRDSDDAGWTCCTYLNGAQSCGVC